MIAALFVLLAIVLILGGALVLLRTAKKPRLPEGFKTKPHYDDDDTGWS